MRLEDKTVLVTGSSSGIGRAICEQLTKFGIKVIGLARHHKKFNPNIVNYVTYEIDIADLESVGRKVKSILKTHPEISGLVSNAGYGDFRNLENFSIEEIINFVNMNLISHIVITRQLLPHFKANKFGDIIFIGSEASLSGSKKGSLYCASKFGLRGFAQSIRQESSDRNVKVSIVNPGMVRTSFFDKLNFKPGINVDNAIEPEDIAKVVFDVLSMNEYTVIDEVNISPLKKVIQFD